MRSFGKPPRALGTFGVAGLLGDEGRVYYENLFSARHVGRVSDLLVAKLKSTGLDELKLRLLVSCGVYEAFGFLAPPGAQPPSQLLPLVTVECGVDSEKIALGVSFVRAATVPFKPQGLEQRLISNQPVGDLERLLAWMLVHADRLVIRYQPSLRRMEVAMLLGIPGKIDAESVAGQHDVGILAFDSAPPRAPRAASYVQLGDLDYHRLLQEDAPGRNLPPSSLGEILAVTLMAESGLPAALLSVRDEEPEATKIKGAARVNPLVKWIAGSKREAEKVTVVGGEDGARDPALMKFSGGPGLPALQEGALTSTDALRYNLRITELQRKLLKLESELSLAKSSAASAPAPLSIEDTWGMGAPSVPKSVASSRNWLSRLLGRTNASSGTQATPIEPGLEGSAPESPVAPPPADDPISASEMMGAKMMADIMGGDDPLLDAPAPAEAVPAGESWERPLLKELNSEIDRTINDASKSVAELKNELKSPKAKRLLDGLMGELVGERAKVQEFARKLNMTVRQKEIEFNSRANQLSEELKRSSEQLRQKASALERTKEQLVRITASMEKLRSRGGGVGAEGAYRAKYEQQGRILEAVKRESMSMIAKIDDLKDQLNAEKLSKSRGPSITDFSSLQGRFERAQRQADEFKRMNQQLLERLNDQRKDRAAQSPPAEEIRKRLEAATKIVAISRKDQERLGEKVEEMRRTEATLKSELAKALIELKRAKAAGFSSSVGAIGVPAVAAKKDPASGGGEAA